MTSQAKIILSIVISLIVAVAAIVLFFISIAKTCKGKKKFIIGIVLGGILGFFGLISAASGAVTYFLTTVTVPAVAKAMEFTPAEGSKPISGTFKFEGEEIKFPVKLSDLTNRGFETDYEYFDKIITIWRKAEGNNKFNSKVFYAYLNKSYSYKSYDKVGFSDDVAAISFRIDDEFGFEFNDIKFGMLKDDFVKEYGTPAHLIADSFYGDSLYYLGDNDVIYRFNFSPSDHTLMSVMVGTSEYMKSEMKGLYHT